VIFPVIPPRTLVLFNYDWDRVGFARWSREFPHDSAGFDLFSFPSNARLAGFDLERFVARLAKQAGKHGWQAVSSNHEQFGALGAALLAERMGWPGTPVNAILACQHKLYARQVLADVCPESNTGFAPLPARYGDPAPSLLPDGLSYPLFIKPVKAAFSVLARVVRNRDELHEMTRFGAWELWIIRHLVEPFERVVKKRLPQAGSAHRLLIEQPVQAAQYNLDGYVFNGALRPLGIVASIMYPGTQAFMRFDYPSSIPAAGQAKAIDTARRFLQAVGFTHGLFNMEFFYDAATDKLTVIEFNPRMAAQFSDLYLRVDGIDLHRVALELAFGRDPALLPRAPATAGIATSLVYRAFAANEVPAMPSRVQQAAFQAAFPDALLFRFPKPRGSMTRDFKWLGSYRYGIVHLGGRDQADLFARCQQASQSLGWAPPCAHGQPNVHDLSTLISETA
jgi:biotin carboxylase